MIYKEVFKDTTKSKTPEFISQLWECLIRCTLLSQPFNPSKYSQFDELLEELMTRLGFESDKTLSIIYLSYLNQLLSASRSAIFNVAHIRSLVQVALKTDSICPLQNWLDAVGSLHQGQPNYQCFRWVKKLLLLIQNEAFKLGGTDNELTLIQLNVGQQYLHFTSL